MRFILLFFAASLTLAFQDPWKEFTDYGGRFRILVPHEMSKKETPIETAVGSLTFHTFYYQPDEKDPDNILYMLSYCDYPEGGMHSDSTELLAEFFDATIDSAVKSVKGELLYADDHSIQGFPGKLWRLIYQDGTASIKTKAVMVNRRFYLLQAIGLRDKGLNPMVDRYLDSFRFVTEGTTESE